MDELDEMVKRGKILGFDEKALYFAAGYMRESNRTLHLSSSRRADPAKLAEEADFIFINNSFVQVILWCDDFGGALARADRARSGKIVFSGKEYCFTDDS